METWTKSWLRFFGLLAILFTTYVCIKQVGKNPLVIYRSPCCQPGVIYESRHAIEVPVPMQAPPPAIIGPPSLVEELPPPPSPPTLYPEPTVVPPQKLAEPNPKPEPSVLKKKPCQKK